MHVLHYVTDFLEPVGGRELFVRGLIFHLQKFGINQSVITDSRTDSTQTVQFGNVKVFALRSIRIGYYSILPDLFNVLHNLDFDIVNIHGYGDYVGDVFCISKKLGRLDVPLIMTTHGIGALRLGYLAVDHSMPIAITLRIRALIHHYFYDFVLGRINMKTLEKVILLAEEERKYLSKIGLKNEKCLKIPIAINEIFFKPGLIVPLCNRDYILYVGRIDSSKGLDTLVRAIKELQLTGHSLKCIIVGKDTGYRSKLESLVDRLEITHLVEIRDYLSQENLLELYSSALVTVLTSLAEGFPITLVESLALGTPFIATPVGAIPELVESTQAGLLVPIADPKALSQAIHVLSEDNNLWSKMSSNGRSSAKNFTWDTIAKRYYEVYSKIHIERR
jgi:glycosyltransferase involved in cell wall biosynthesis